MGPFEPADLIWLGLAYVSGSIPYGLLIARLHGVDLQKVGSGNIGATNAVRALGKGWGIAVFVLDALKAGIPVLVADHFTPPGAQHQAVVASAGLLAVLGHVYSVFLGLKGGKGVACAFGVFLALDPRLSVAAIALYIQGLWLTRTSAVGSLGAVTGFSLFMLLVPDRPPEFRALAAALAVLIWVKHAPNIRTLRQKPPKAARETSPGDAA